MGVNPDQGGFMCRTFPGRRTCVKVSIGRPANIWADDKLERCQKKEENWDVFHWLV